MQTGIHPKLKKIKVITTNKKSFTTYSTYKEDEIILDTDPYNHPAWNKDKRLIRENVTNIAKFKSRFGDIDGTQMLNLMNKKSQKPKKDNE